MKHILYDENNSKSQHLQHDCVSTDSSRPDPSNQCCFPPPHQFPGCLVTALSEQAGCWDLDPAAGFDKSPDNCNREQSVT